MNTRLLRHIAIALDAALLALAVAAIALSLAWERIP
jgi:hypothetical protein